MVEPKRTVGKNCNKMQNEDQISTYVRQMTDDAGDSAELDLLWT